MGRSGRARRRQGPARAARAGPSRTAYARCCSGAILCRGRVAAMVRHRAWSAARGAAATGRGLIGRTGRACCRRGIAAAGSPPGCGIARGPRFAARVPGRRVGVRAIDGAHRRLDLHRRNRGPARSGAATVPRGGPAAGGRGAPTRGCRLAPRTRPVAPLPGRRCVTAAAVPSRTARARCRRRGRRGKTRRRLRPPRQSWMQSCRPRRDGPT
jgi:hypothetical protein